MSQDGAGVQRKLTDFPDTLPLLTLANVVVFPMSVIPLHVASEAEVKLIDYAVMGPKFLAMITRVNADDEQVSIDNLHRIGCVGRIVQFQRVPDGSINVLVQAVQRFQIARLEQREPVPIARIVAVEDPPYDKAEVAPLMKVVKTQMTRLIELTPNLPDGAAAALDNITDPGFLADLIAGTMNVSTQEKQSVLDTIDRRARLEKLAGMLAREVELLEVSDKIQQDVKSSIDAGQREFFLRQQLKAIQEQLGEGEADRPVVQEYRQKLGALQASEEVKKEAQRELDRLSQMNEASAEYHVITTYLDWVFDLPWQVATPDQLDIARAETILNEDHYGLDKIKKRILEYLAVRKLKPDAPGPILCFVGPPGVGKTSLGQSIARALGRKFVRMSLGGMRDEAEIRGHRKTYVGALPGRIIQNMRKAQSNNPVYMLDEIDKVGMDFRGDPSSALLEVLDPAQNNTFNDLYLGVPFDLSNVMFIATANVLDTIPWALQDRMEVIQLPGYTLEEKLHIAQQFLVPRQIEAHGLTPEQVTLGVGALRVIISAYTREAGVRNLEREIANVLRGCARQFASGRTEPIKIKQDALKEYLGNPRFIYDVVERASMPGVATGLAWTATGGDILFIEATRMPGKGNLILTGQLGDVMKESAQAVLSYIRTNAAKLGLDNDDFSQYDVHIHVPAGAVPKDGPSAGVAILSAMASMLTGRKVKDRLAMTGEITLRGTVLPVGGVKEKVLAAARARIKEVILPRKCENDLEDVPDTVAEKMKIHLVDRMEEVLEIALAMDLKP